MWLELVKYISAIFLLSIVIFCIFLISVIFILFPLFYLIDYYVLVSSTNFLNKLVPIVFLLSSKSLNSDKLKDFLISYYFIIISNKKYIVNTIFKKSPKSIRLCYNVNMILRNIKMNLCSHKYKEVAFFENLDCFASFFECEKCGERKVFLENGIAGNFTNFYIKKATMWANYQYDLVSTDITRNIKNIEFLERCLNE